MHGETDGNPLATKEARVVHGAFTIGLVIALPVFAYLRHSEGGQGDDDPFIGYVLGGQGLGLLALAFTVLRRRVRRRLADESRDCYWATDEVRSRAIVLWAFAEASGISGGVGYLLTGTSLPAVAAALAIATLILFRPSRIEANEAESGLVEG